MLQQVRRRRFLRWDYYYCQKLRSNHVSFCSLRGLAFTFFLLFSLSLSLSIFLVLTLFLSPSNSFFLLLSILYTSASLMRYAIVFYIKSRLPRGLFLATHSLIDRFLFPAFALFLICLIHSIDGYDF